jgi:hypothetical protein
MIVSKLSAIRLNGVGALMTQLVVAPAEGASDCTSPARPARPAIRPRTGRRMHIFRTPQDVLRYRSQRAEGGPTGTTS